MKAMIILTIVFLALSLVSFFAIPFHALAFVLGFMFMAGVVADLFAMLVVAHTDNL